MIIKEFRIILPISVEEFQVAQLYSVAEASKNETGGGEGIEVQKNHPFVDEGFGEDVTGQYTLKVYHMASRAPSFLKYVLPKGSLEFREEAHNAYPYCKTVITNPKFMKGKMCLSIETKHESDFGDSENVHKLSEKEWKKTEVVNIDIANDSINSSDYKPEEDPKKFTPKAEGRGPLTTDWVKKLKSDAQSGKYDNIEPKKRPYMCAYKLVKINFQWLGLQNMVEKFVQKQERRVFFNFHRQAYCWMDRWHGLNMDDIRELEDKAQADLDNMRKQGSIKGTQVTD